VTARTELSPHDDARVPRLGPLVQYALLAGPLLSMIDSSIVNVAVEPIARELHAGLTTVQWTVSGYLLALALAPRPPPCPAPVPAGRVPPAPQLTSAPFAWTIGLSWKLWATPVARIVHESRMFHDLFEAGRHAMPSGNTGISSTSTTGR
jgi:MFS family permease